MRDKIKVRFEDEHNVCFGTIRKKNIKNFSDWTNHPLEIYGALDDLRGTIEIPYWTNLKTSKFRTYNGPRVLFDTSGNKVATSGVYTYDNPIIDPFVFNFEFLRMNGLDFKTPEGAVIASIRDSKGRPGCQIDLFPPINDVLSVFNLVVYVLIL